MTPLKDKCILIGLACVAGLASCQSRPPDAPAKVMLEKTVVETVESRLTRLEAPVTLHFYRGSGSESGSDKTNALLDLMSGKSQFLQVEKHDLDQAPHVREAQKADRGPIVIPEGPDNSRSSFLGYPSRRELAPFLDSILIVSGQVEDLTPGTESFLRDLDEEVFLRIFTTPD